MFSIKNFVFCLILLHLLLITQMILSFNQDVTGQPQDKSTVLSLLNNFVTSALLLSTNVREIMENQCDEANFVLRPWINETVSLELVDEKSCTCSEGAGAEGQAEKIATGIEKALTQAQKLRQTISARIPSIHYINKPNKKIYAKSNKTDMKNAIHAPEGSARYKESKCKNFIALNKSNIRMMSRKNSKPTSSLKDETKCDTVAELNKLIEKVSMEDTNCPLHGNNEAKILTEKKRITTDIVEHLHEFGIADSLLKPLKTYNYYINKRCERKTRNMTHKFVDSLALFHKKESKKFGSSDIASLAIGFSHLYRELHRNSSSSPPSLPHHTKKMYDQLNDLSKICKIKKYDSQKIGKLSMNRSAHCQSIDKGWLYNGIWNFISFKYFSMFTRSLAIEYNNENELLSLFDSIQALQYVIYEKKIQDLIINGLIPSIKELNPASPEYRELYKMVFAIVQILNPEKPVLVKTERVEELVTIVS